MKKGNKGQTNQKKTMKKKKREQIDSKLPRRGKLLRRGV